MFCENDLFLIELKTTVNSVRKDQIKYLREARDEKKPKKVMDDFFYLCNIESGRPKEARNKYKTLKKHITEKVGVTPETNLNGDIRIVYILPKKRDVEIFQEILRNSGIAFDCGDFITFSEIGRYINEYLEHAHTCDENIYARFTESLVEWENEMEIPI